MAKKRTKKTKKRAKKVPARRKRRNPINSYIGASCRCLDSYCTCECEGDPQSCNCENLKSLCSCGKVACNCNCEGDEDTCICQLRTRENPWTGRDVSRHNKRCASKAKCRKKWPSIANAVLRETGDEGRAIRIANWQTKRMGLRRNPENYSPNRRFETPMQQVSYDGMVVNVYRADNKLVVGIDTTAIDKSDTLRGAEGRPNLRIWINGKKYEVQATGDLVAL